MRFRPRPGCVGGRVGSILPPVKTCTVPGRPYAYEEFLDHIRAMKTVREWQYTSRFGHVGNDQTCRASNARVLEYFSDSYDDQTEALHKAELFLSIQDYLGRHAALFARKRMLETPEAGVLLVEPWLLRAVHHVFSVLPEAQNVAPKKVLALAKALRDISA